MSFYKRLFKKRKRVEGAGSGASPIPSYLMPPDGAFSKIGFQIYEALDLICEGPILGLTDQNGKILKGGCAELFRPGPDSEGYDHCEPEIPSPLTPAPPSPISTQAVHVYDSQNAELTRTDVWKFQVSTRIENGLVFVITVEKTPISRDPDDSFPENSGIRMVDPDGVVIDAVSSSYTQHAFSETNITVGDVWSIQYLFRDASNYVGDVNKADTGWITFAKVTYGVGIEILLFDELYDTRSFERKPGT